MCCFYLANQNLLSAEDKQAPRIDILIFSPHPDDETIACAGVILKAVQDNKTIKVIFLTNGDAFTSSCAAWLKKKPEELTAKDYVSFGQERCNEAQKAAKRLSLNPQDEIFLSFPDKGLLPLWEEKYDDFYLSETTKKGYSRQNILMDITDILAKYKPREIYMPHPLDTNNDHQAAAYFINCALGALRSKENKWLDDLKVSYYLIHGFLNNVKLKKLAVFSQTTNSRRNITNFQKQKELALNEYITQLNTEKEKSFLKNFVKEEELFWDLSTDKDTYLQKLEEEWLGIAKIMRQVGFNVNFGPVVDVAEEIEDRDIFLVRRQRLYSQSPNNVIELASRVIEGLNKGGVIPVLKHFPGLGAARLDTHIQLPILEKTKERFYNEDLVPFKSLINKYPNIWVMIDHAVYPSLSDKPASLSHEIQTNILRKELGFKGIIIADELLNMQSILEFVYREKIPQPFIGEIIARAFQAGTDIALIYPVPEKAEEVISCIIQSVINTIREGRLKEEEINLSVMRILKEKERVFGRPLLHLLKKMSIEEKICQKIAVDSYGDTKLLNKYNFCGIRPRAEININILQNQAKIPMFIFAQHEGGVVNDRWLNLSTRSAYIVGREFERLADKNMENISNGAFGSRNMQISSAGKKQERGNISKTALRGVNYDKAISSLLDSTDRLIELFSELGQKGSIPAPHPNYLTPLTVNLDNSFELKPFNRLPVIWLRSFSDEASAVYTYEIFKNIYQEWRKKQDGLARGAEDIVPRLISLRKALEKTSGKEEDKSNIRVLCLAAHPDDEDGEALAYFGKKFHCQTFILLATRGEAGENAVTASFYEELGALRTEEIEKSAVILGVKKVYYLGKKDFGYSVDPQEAFKNWDKQDTLEKLVYFIRLIRPHIIITKHNTTNRREHGQHQALSILAEEAFDLAGNPQSYPWMINAGLSVWQPDKFYQRLIGRGGGDVSFNTKPVILDILEPFDSKNKNCQQIATEALNQHKSQMYLPRFQGNKTGKILYQLVKAKPFVLTGDSFFDLIKAGASLIEPVKEVSLSGLPGVLIANKLRIALFEGNSNIMFVALKTLGCDFKSLDEDYIVNGDLTLFDTIILGQGVYTFYKAFEEANSRLLEFVKNGGNLIVFQQYSLGQDMFNYAPYPFKISFEPVVNQDIPVNILVPKHQLFNFPNQIYTRDFNGWVQDRGMFFPKEYSNVYTELTKCYSARGNQVSGGYLVADYGKGSYIYTGYTWYRQLREFHVGAYKNLSNMLAYPFAKKFSTFEKKQ